MPEVLNAIREFGLAIVALVIVSGALAVTARVLYRELKERIHRAENLTDEANVLNDKLAENFGAALDELRRR